MKPSLRCVRHPALMAALAGCAIAHSAHAQTAWSAAANGSWTNAANWTAGVPNSVSSATLGLAGPYTVTLQNANGICPTLTITNPAAILNVFDSSQLDVAGNISNVGVIQISGPGAPGNLTRLSAAAPNVVHSGGGTIRLAASGTGDNDTAYITNQVGSSLINAAGSFVRGAGRIYTPFTNQGTVNADQNGKVLVLLQSAKSNDGLMTASNGGVLILRTALTQSATGVVRSGDNSPVQINNFNALVTGGTLDGAGLNSGVQYTGVTTLDAVTLQNANMVMDSVQVNIGAAGVVNNGLWTVSAPTAPGNLTRISSSVPTTVSGTGTIRLQGIASGNGDNDTAYLTYSTVAATLTNASTHSIRGYGRIYTPLINNGTVNADVAGKGLYMIDQPKTNNGTMTASNGGTLVFRNVSVTGNPAAQIISTDASSPVQFFSSTLSGGGFTTSGTGVFQYFGNSALSNLTVNGTHQVTDATQVNLNTNLVNNGTWLVSTPTAPGNLTRISTAAPAVTISGTGTIRLQGIQSGNGDNDTAYLTSGAAANVLTLGSNQQLRGYGRVYTNLVNNGTINADNTPNASGPASKGLVFIDQPKTNNGTITASNGGFVEFRSVSVTGNPAAQIISTDAASPVRIVSSTLSGGGFTTSGTGVFQYFQTNTLSNLTVNGTHQITDASLVNLNTDLVNNGTWLISTPTAPGNNTRMQPNAAAVTINGTGTIRLQGIQSGNGDNDTAYLQYTAAANVLTLGANQQLRGYGRVYTNLVNNGTINADNTPNASGPTSKGIVFIDQPKTNNSTITSSNEGFWLVRSTTLTNNGAMTSTNTATPGGIFQSCTVSGGTLSNIAGQAFRTVGIVNLNAVTITPGSGIQVSDASTLTTTGLTNNGTITIQTIGAPGNITRLTASGPAAIGGTGTLRLRATAFNSDSASIDARGTGNSLTLSSGQTITGSGRLYGPITINGTVSPDQPFGTPTPWGSIQPLSGTLTFGTTSAYNTQIRSMSSFDSMQGNSAIVINGGTINVSFDPAYVTNPVDLFDVVVGTSLTGQFATVNIAQPAAYPAGPAHVAHRPDRVRVVMCYANCDGSNVTPVLNALDFSCFLNRYTAGDPYANCDGSTVVPTLNALDFACFLNKFRAGCN